MNERTVNCAKLKFKDLRFPHTSIIIMMTLTSGVRDEQTRSQRKTFYRNINYYLWKFIHDSWACNFSLPHPKLNRKIIIGEKFQARIKVSLRLCCQTMIT